MEMVGTLRAFDETMRADAKERITRTAESIASTSGATAEVSFGPSAYPVTTNPEALTEMMAPVLKKVSGGKAMQTSRLMASEDFSYMLEKVPGAFINIGNGVGSVGGCMVHNAGYDFNDRILSTGATYWVKLVERWLAKV